MINEISQSTPPSAKVQRDLTRLREAAGEVVGKVFYGKLLSAMRESGGSAGKASRMDDEKSSSPGP